MITLISPAKTLDFSNNDITGATNHAFPEESEQLIKILRKFSAPQISKLMSISDKLGALNVKRYKDYNKIFSAKNSSKAIYAFKGDVYEGLDITSFAKKDITYAQSHLRILSGLYGLLRPNDLIQAYRLEMGTKLENPGGKNLYNFWGDKITNQINDITKDNDFIINLASDEYFKVINKKILKPSIITPIFKDRKNDTYKVISFYAKKARGMMAAYIIKNQISSIEGLKKFNQADYKYNQSLSKSNQLVFTRG